MRFCEHFAGKPPRTPHSQTSAFEPRYRAIRGQTAILRSSSASQSESTRKNLRNCYAILTHRPNARRESALYSSKKKEALH